MNELEKRVLHSFKWKKGVAYCAKKLGISESEYSKVKSKLRKTSIF